MFIPSRSNIRGVIQYVYVHKPVDTNFILTYAGSDQPDMKKVTATLYAHQVHVLDGSMLPGMALVQLDESKLDAFRTELDEEWNVYSEKSYRIPSVKKKITKDIE